MRTILLSTILLAILSQAPIAFPAEPDSLSEAEPAWSGGVEMTGTNNYLWRGMTVNEAAILQPNVWITRKNITLSLWSSWSLSTPKDDIKRPEIDAALTYAFAWQNFAFETYFNYYHYINQPDAPSTGELACIVGYPVGILTLKAGFMYDIVEYTGALYTQEGVEIEKELTDQVSASGALMLGAGSAKFNDAYFGLSKATASLLSIDGRLTWTLPTGLYLQPWFQYNRTLNHELKPYLKNHTSSFGLTAGKEF